MGADIYLRSIYEKNDAQYRPEMERLSGEMSKLQRETPEWVILRDQWNECYAKVYSSEAYFRDSYNTSSLLWQFGLSWWRDIGERLDDDGVLLPDGCQWLLDQLNLPENVAKLQSPDNTGDWDESAEEIVAYYTDKHARLCDLLRRAIELNEGLDCSI